MKTTVWIVNDAGHPYDKADSVVKESEITYRPMTEGDVNILHVDRLNYHLTRAIAGYAEEDDYVLISGSPVINACALAIWLLHFNQCKLLVWNAKDREYELSIIEKENLQRQLQRNDRDG